MHARPAVRVIATIAAINVVDADAPTRRLATSPFVKLATQRVSSPERSRPDHVETGERVFKFDDCAADSLSDGIPQVVTAPGSSVTLPRQWIVTMKKFLGFAILGMSLTLSGGCCGPLWTAGCRTGACGTVGCASPPISVGHMACDGHCEAGCTDGCGSCDGCGELYVDPWINHPPDCCDPCDCCGNYNGQSCGKCRPVFSGIKSLWGYRCVDNCGGCEDCASGPFNSCGGGGCENGCAECNGGTIIHHGDVHGSPMGEGVIYGDDTSAPLPPPVPLSQAPTAPIRTLAIQRNSTSNPRPAKPIFRPRHVSSAASGY